MNPDLLVSIQLRPASAGGRQSAIPAGEYRGIVGVRGVTFSMRWLLPDGKRIEPGGPEERVGLQFLDREIATPNFMEGTSFEVWEGKVIGEGRVVEVLVRRDESR